MINNKNIETRDDLIQFFIESLGPSWVNYGIEVVEAADTALQTMNKKELDSVEGYSSRILYRQILKSKIKENKHTKDREDVIDLDSLPNRTSTLNESAIFFDKYMSDKLSEVEYEVYSLRYVDGLTTGDIATKLGVCRKTVSNMLQKILNVGIEY